MVKNVSQFIPDVNWGLLNTTATTSQISVKFTTYVQNYVLYLDVRNYFTHYVFLTKRV
jgi:hypothetical protein